jgi:hypothetical protein
MAPNMPEAIARTVDKPKSVESCANAAKVSMASYKARKMAGTKTDPPEVDREFVKKEDVTKTSVRQPKGECDPESDLPCSWPIAAGPPMKIHTPPDTPRVYCRRPTKVPRHFRPEVEAGLGADVKKGHEVPYEYAIKKKTLEINPRHPPIKELQRRVEDNAADKSASGMAVIMYNTAKSQMRSLTRNMMTKTATNCSTM